MRLSENMEATRLAPVLWKQLGALPVDRLKAPKLARDIPQRNGNRAGLEHQKTEGGRTRFGQIVEELHRITARPYLAALVVIIDGQNHRGGEKADSEGTNLFPFEVGASSSRLTIVSPDSLAAVRHQRTHFLQQGFVGFDFGLPLLAPSFSLCRKPFLFLGGHLLFIRSPPSIMGQFDHCPHAGTAFFERLPNRQRCLTVIAFAALTPDVPRTVAVLSELSPEPHPNLDPRVTRVR
ncbi:hypothetical protein D3C84_444250 [compost metagenome]